MSVLLQTSKGDLVVDLFFEKCPKTCLNFLSLCKIKYYHNCPIFNVQRDFAVQTGDPSGTGKGGSSIFELIEHRVHRQSASTGKRFFVEDECHDDLKHDKPGLLSMSNLNMPHTNSSLFFITTSPRPLEYLDGKHTVFGQVVEGAEGALRRINAAFVDQERNAPLAPIRILRTEVLVDPFEHDAHLQAHFFPLLARLTPAQSPAPILDGYDSEEEERKKKKKVGGDGGGEEEQKKKEEEEEADALKRKEARSRAVVLEILGDIPDAELKAPENVLFVCKLNPVTADSSLELIFSRFGKIKSCEIIRDHSTGDSLCYGFIEFDKKESCEEAYLKMENVVIDDRRIHVDFSQSVSKLWKRYHSQGKNQQKHNWNDKDLPHEKRKGRKQLQSQQSQQSQQYDRQYSQQNQSQQSQQNQSQHHHHQHHQQSRHHQPQRRHGSESSHRYEQSDYRRHHHSPARHRRHEEERHKRKRSRYSSSDSEGEGRRKKHKSRSEYPSSPTSRRYRRSKS